MIATAQSNAFLKRTGLAPLFNESGTLENLNLTAENCEAILSTLCAQLNFDRKIVCENLLKKKALASLSIRELRYQLKKFIAQNSDKDQLDVRAFIKKNRTIDHLSFCSTKPPV